MRFLIFLTWSLQRPNGEGWFLCLLSAVPAPGTHGIRLTHLQDTKPGVGGCAPICQTWLHEDSGSYSARTEVPLRAKMHLSDDMEAGLKEGPRMVDNSKCLHGSLTSHTNQASHVSCSQCLKSCTFTAQGPQGSLVCAIGRVGKLQPRGQSTCPAH